MTISRTNYTLHRISNESNDLINVCHVAKINSARQDTTTHIMLKYIYISVIQVNGLFYKKNNYFYKIIIFFVKINEVMS